MLKLALLLTPKAEPYQIGEFSSEYMTRVQSRAADYSILFGWIPGIPDQIFTWTTAQKRYFDELNAIYQESKP